jgi:hypothetical protein
MMASKLLPFPDARIHDFFFFPITFKILATRDIISIYHSLDLVQSFMIAFEEFFELLGESFILYGFMLFAANKIASPEA